MTGNDAVGFLYEAEHYLNKNGWLEERMSVDYSANLVTGNCSFSEGDGKNMRVAVGIEEFFVMPEKGFPKCVMKHKCYDFSQDNDGVLVEYGRKQRNMKLFGHYQTFMSGMKQDWIMVLAYVCLYDRNDEIRKRPVFRDMDMYPEAAVARFRQPVKPLPSRHELLLRQIDSELDRIAQNDRDGPYMDDGYGF